MDANINLVVRQHHRHTTAMHFGVTTMHLMVGLRREQANIGLGNMIRDTRKEDLLSICVNKLVECCVNTNNTVDLVHILDEDIILHIVNEVAPEWCQTK